MFDLFRSREKTVRYLLGALLTLVAASMVITLVPGYGGGWGSQGASNPTVLAEVAGEQITASDVRQFIAREMRGNSLPRGMEAVYIPMIVQQMAAQKAVGYQAAEMGIKITDAQLAQIVHTLVPQLWQDGKFVGKEIYAQMLSQQGMTIPQFEENVRAQALQSRLETLALEGIIVTPADVENEFKHRNEKIKVAYFGLGPDFFKSKVATTPAELQEFYNKGKSSYLLPEKRSYLVFPIDEAAIAATIKVPDAQLQAAYAQQQERFRTPERVQARHILLKTTDKTPAEVAAIQKRMEDMLAQLKKGANFADLAKKNSEDPGSGAKGGELGWITRGQTVPEFEKAAFTLKTGELSALVKTQYGFHIIRVDAHEQARLRPLEEVKAELNQDLVRAQVFEKMQSISDQIRTTLVRSREEAEKLAAANGITAVKAENVAKGEPVQGVGVSVEFNEAVAALPKNGVTPIIQVGQNKLVVAQVTEITPSRPAQFAEVEDKVKEGLIAEKSFQMAQQKIVEAGEKLKTTTDLAALAKSYGAELKTSELVNREGAITGVGAASSIDAAFNKNVGDVVGPVQTGNGTFFMKIVEKVPADLTQLALAREELLKTLKQRRAQERVELFRDGIVQELIKKKKVKIYEDNVKRLVAASNS
ncbi:MAG: peptidyl-prolyl cis-trans isomerase [Acidobacteria bacterium]|nr:peptidyl-prolyl cis-trans isomerase [Acidobacteriota bacterium]